MLHLLLLFGFVPAINSIKPVNWAGRHPDYECVYEGFGNELCLLEGIQMNETHDQFGIWPGQGNFQETHILEIRDSKIPLLNHDFCHTFPNLKEIRLRSVYINSIKATILKDCRSLRKFELVDSNINELPSGLFRETPNLETLTIRSTAITELDENLFNSLGNLQTLNVILSRLIAFPATLLRKLTQLNKLSLAGNEILDINERLFVENLPQLLRINLQHNNLLCSRVEKIMQVFHNKGIAVDVDAMSTEPKVKEKYQTQNVRNVNSLECLPEGEWLRVKADVNFILQESTTGLSKGDDKNIVKTLVNEQDRRYHELMARVEEAEARANMAIQAARGILGT